MEFYKYIFVLAVFLQTLATNSLAGPIPQTGWSLLFADSEELVGENGAAVNAFDGDINTIWHTAWSRSSNSTTTPHNIDIYLGNSYQPDEFHYLPHQGGADIGRINQYDPACYKQFFINQIVFLRKPSRQQSG